MLKIKSTSSSLFTLIKIYNLPPSNTIYGPKKIAAPIVKAFLKYPFNKLAIKELDRRNKYTLQIISKKDRKNIFNASSKITIETTPVFAECEDLIYSKDIKTCLLNAMKKHLYSTLDFFFSKR